MSLRSSFSALHAGRRRAALTALTAVTTCGLLASSPLAHAEPSDAERALARTLFADGRALVKEGRHAEACPKLAESQRLDPGVGTLFNLGDCYEATGRTASAWAAFSEVADLAHLAGHADREAVAKARASALAPRLARLRVRAPSPAPTGLEIELDGRPLPPAALDTDLPVDPGTHVVAAKAPDRRAFRGEVRIPDEAKTSVLDLPALEDDAPPAPAAAPAPRATARPPEPPAPRPADAPPGDERPWQRPVALGTGALGVVALGIGAGFGLAASSSWGDARPACPNDVCTPDGRTAWEDARGQAAASTAFFVTGAVLVAAGAVLFFTAPPAAPKRVEAAPWLPRVRRAGARGAGGAPPRTSR